MEEAEHYRCRRIYLKQSDDPRFQAQAACDALANLEGIVLAAPHSADSVHIIYSLDELSFEIVVELLIELDFKINDSLLMSLRTTLFGYLEDNARDHFHADAGETVADHHDDADIHQSQNEKYWDDYH